MTSAVTPGSSSPPLGIEGELTIFTASALRETLLAALDGNIGEIRLDLSRVNEVDSAGLQLLLAARREAEARGKTLCLAEPGQAVAEILKFCGLSSLLSPCGSLE